MVIFNDTDPAASLELTEAGDLTLKVDGKEVATSLAFSDLARLIEAATAALVAEIVQRS